MIGCKRVIGIRLTSCELANWCFGPPTTMTAYFRIICAAQVRAQKRLKRPVLIWLSFKCEGIHLCVCVCVGGGLKKQGSFYRTKWTNGLVKALNVKPNHNLRVGRNGLVVLKRGEEVGDGEKIDSCVQRKSSAQLSVWPERRSHVWFSANQSF